MTLIRRGLAHGFRWVLKTAAHATMQWVLSRVLWPATQRTYHAAVAHLRRRRLARSHDGSRGTRGGHLH